jgi:hypothetical protein
MVNAHRNVSKSDQRRNVPVTKTSSWEMMRKHALKYTHVTVRLMEVAATNAKKLASTPCASVTRDRN